MPQQPIPDSPATPQEIHLLVSGRVQRVRFRLFVKQLAEDLDLTGWVRNRGQQVEILAQGSRHRLANLIRQVAEGPPGAEVQSVSREWRTVRHPARRFRIRWLYVI